jgi:hypothetical protein
MEMLAKTIEDREYRKFKWTSQKEAVKVAIVENYFSLDLAFKMLSKNTSIDLSDVNTVNFNATEDLTEVYFLDSSENLLATLSYNGVSASWSAIVSALLLESGDVFLLESGEPLAI